MKNLNFPAICLSVCFLCWKLALAANAQISDIKNSAEQKAAMTKPGYYIQKQVLSVIDNLDPCTTVADCRFAGLPVELLYFSGERKDNETVILKWETVSEVNNDYFQIERTLNPVAGFETIATIKGRGTSSENVSYNIADRNEIATYTYYRLKQVDFDGKYDYSPIIAVRGAAASLSMITLPNPGLAKDIRFRISGLPRNVNAAVSVYDVQGRIIYNNPRLMVFSEQDIKLDLPDLTPGKYSIKWILEDRELINSFVISR